MAEPRKIAPRTGGVETSLEGVGTLYMVASIIALVGCVVLSGQDSTQKLGLSPFLIGIGIAAAIQGYVFRTLFKAAGEIIRLLKRSNGLPYAGSLSQSEGEGDAFVCTDCGEPIAKRDKYCTQCGATF
jgi:hypothetical protein